MRSLIPSAASDRAAMGALVILAIAIALIVAVGGGTSEPPPATGAAGVVPADALAYVHLSTDPSRPAVGRALRLALRLPSYPLALAAVESRVGAIAGGSPNVDFVRDVQPWLGREAALALLNTPSSTAGSLVVLDVRERRAAQQFLDRAGALAAGSYRGAQLLRYSTGTELSFVKHYLVLGQDASVRAAIDVASGASSSLQGNPAYRRAAAGEPADRVLDAYASVAGVRRLLAPQGGIVGALGVLLYQPALTGTAISLSAGDRALRVRVHSALDPTLARVNRPRPATFTPDLDTIVPAGTMLMLDVTGLDKLAPHVLDAGAAGGIAGRLGPLLSRLGGALTSQGFNTQDVVSLFSRESVLAITSNGHKPSFVIVARTADESRARTALAALEAPLAQLFPPAPAGPGQAPLFNDRQIDGVTAHQLKLAPGLEFDYAVAHGLVILATGLDGIGAVVRQARPLVNDSAYRETLAARPHQLTSLLFLDFRQLLRLGEQTGLTRSARFRALRGDLEKIRAIGLDATTGENDSTAELFLLIP